MYCRPPPLRGPDPVQRPQFGAYWPLAVETLYCIQGKCRFPRGYFSCISIQTVLAVAETTARTSTVLSLSASPFSRFQGSRSVSGEHLSF